MTNEVLHAYKWFYSNPGHNRGEVNERVRITLWSAGLGSIWVELTEMTQTTYRMDGFHFGTPICLEWEPRKFFSLCCRPDQPALAKHFEYILGIKANFKFVDADEMAHYEWHLADADSRWRALSGNPAFQGLEKLTA